MEKGKRTKRRTGLAKDTSGQMSIDFLAGVAIFTLAFIYIFTFIPSMFTPFQSNSDEMTMVADRVSTVLVNDVLLVESPDYNANRPNVIDAKKLESIDFTTQTGLKKLGLDGDRLYNVHVTLVIDKPTDPTKYRVDFGAKYPEGAVNIGQSKRIVVVSGADTVYDTSTPQQSISYSVTPGESNVGILTVTVW